MKRLVIPFLVMVSCAIVTVLFCREAVDVRDSQIASADMARQEIKTREGYREAIKRNKNIPWPDLTAFRTDIPAIPISRFRDVPGLIGKAAAEAGVNAGPVSMGIGREGYLVVGSVTVVTDKISSFRKFIENMAPFMDKVIQVDVRPDEMGVAYLVEISVRFAEGGTREN